MHARWKMLLTLSCTLLCFIVKRRDEKKRKYKKKSDYVRNVPPLIFNPHIPFATRPDHYKHGVRTQGTLGNKQMNNNSSISWVKKKKEKRKEKERKAFVYINFGIKNLQKQTQKKPNLNPNKQPTSI